MRGLLHGDFDGLCVGGRKAASGFEVAQCVVENQVDKIANPERVEHERFGAALRLTPSKGINPHEAQWIAQQAAQRTGRLGPAEDSEDERMVRSHQTIMGGDFDLSPVAPADLRADGLGIGGEVLGPSHQAIGFAEGVRRRCVAAQIGLVHMSGEQRAAAKEAPFAVAPCARQDDGVACRGEDRLEVAPVGEIDWQRIEHWGRDDVVGDQAVFGEPARPAGRI